MKKGSELIGLKRCNNFYEFFCNRQISNKAEFQDTCGFTWFSFPKLLKNGNSIDS